MKRKIALLLAFVMILSMLPMSLAGAAPQGQGTRRTGSRAEVSPLTGVRHMGNGSVSATTGTWNQFQNNAQNSSWVDPNQGVGTFTRTSGPVHITADASYFQSPAGYSTTNVQVNLHNAWWVASHITNMVPSVVVMAPPAPPMPIGPELIGQVARGPEVSGDTATSGGALAVSTNAGHHVFTRLSTDNPRAFEALGNIFARAGIDGFNAFLPPPRPPVDPPVVPPVDPTGFIQAQVAPSLATVLQPGPVVPPRAPGVLADMNDQAADEIAILFNQLFSGQSRIASMSMIDVSGANPAWSSFLLAWIEILTGPTGTNTPLGRSNTQARLSMVRFGTDGAGTPILVPASSAIEVQLPVEFITRSDANDNPVFLSYVPFAGGWGIAGSLQNRTDLTTTAEGRFNITRPGGPRSFHRFGRVQVYEGIRIAEATVGAFDANNYHIELEILTTGFYWAAESENFTNNTTGAHFVTRYGGVNGTERNVGGTHIGGVNATNISRLPTSGTNAGRTLSFDLTLGAATTTPRWELDWLEIKNLFIAASDSARPGDVEVEVRVRRPRNWQGGNANWSLVETWTTAGAGVAGVTQASRPTTIAGTVPNLGVAGTHQVWREIANTNNFNWQVGTPAADWEIAGTITLANQSAAGGNWGLGEIVDESTIVGAVYGNVGLEFYIHPDFEPPELRSGERNWSFVQETLDNWGWNNNTWGGIGATAQGARPIGAVGSLSDIEWRDHRMARAVLRETVAGSMPGTGAAPITFEFGEGVQVLGVRIWTNEAHFSRAGEDQRDGGGTPRRNPGEVTFGYLREPDNFFSTTINRNEVIIRPEIGQNIDRRWRIAEIMLEFYVSVMPGFEHAFGHNELEVTAKANVDGYDWEESALLAYAWDPITIDVTPVTLDDVTDAAVGIVRDVPINNVVISETESGALLPGTRIWIGVEGGVSRGWNAADHLSIAATHASVVGCDQMRVSPVRVDSHGVFVEVERASRTGGAQIVFENVVLSGRVIPGQEYNVFVAENAVAANWEGLNWIRDSGFGVGFSLGAVRGFFDNEPYTTPAFAFEGADVFAPPVIDIPAITMPTLPRSVTLFEGMNFTTTDGETLMAPLFVLRPNPNSPPGTPLVTSYVMARVVADILNLDWSWDGAGSATFTDGQTTVVFTNNNSTAMVNGAPMEITASGVRADAFIMEANGRFFVPIAFFRQVFGARVDWDPHTPSVTVSSR